MKQIALYITTILILTFCSNNTEIQEQIPNDNNQKGIIEVNDTIQELALWADDYIIEYLEGNKDKLTEIDSHPIAYIKDTVTRKGIKYAIAQIGYNFENRYITKQRIFIDSLAKNIYEYELVNDSLIIWEKYSQFESKTNGILPNGKYQFDIAFAEWQGKSMGEKVIVQISGNLIKIIYEGGGQLSLTEKGEIIDEGLIMKHKSGDWIIGTNLRDKELDEVGGCTGGPAIIDFKNKKYWMC